jgi:hypothetical protein
MERFTVRDSGKGDMPHDSTGRRTRLGTKQREPGTELLILNTSVRKATKDWLAENADANRTSMGAMIDRMVERFKRAQAKQHVDAA